jgi:CubicO group peptidase (beta-lactamase class C family)
MSIYILLSSSLFLSVTSSDNNYNHYNIFAMSTSTSNAPDPYLGRWSGTSTTKPFNDFTIIDILYRDGHSYLHRHDRRSPKPLEGQISYTSNNVFMATVPTWLGGAATINGTFHSNSFGVVLIAKIEGDGLTGLETIEVHLKQGAPEHEKYLAPRLNVAPESHPNNADFMSTAAPEALNMTAEQLDAAIQAIIRPRSHPDNRVEGLLILKDGHRVHESYYYGLTASDSHPCASITKSIVSLLAGIAIDEGFLSLDDPVAAAFDIPSAWTDSPPILLRHALSMTPGTAFSQRDTAKMLTSTSVASLILNAPRRYGDPGAKYHYDNSLPIIVSLLIERKSGLGIEAFARKYLFGPLGITNYTWTRMHEDSVDGTPFVLPSGGLNMTLTDLAKVGELLLGGGAYRGNRIVSADYIEAATKSQTREGDYPYGYFFHSNEGGRHVPGDGSVGAYMALGSGGQVIWVAPRQKLVFVAVGSSWMSFEETPVVLRSFADTVLRGLE